MFKKRTNYNNIIYLCDLISLAYNYIQKLKFEIVIYILSINSISIL